MLILVIAKSELNNSYYSILDTANRISAIRQPQSFGQGQLFFYTTIWGNRNPSVADWFTSLLSAELVYCITF